MKAAASIVIDRPRGEVFAFVADVAHMPVWLKGVSEPERTSQGDFGLGSTLVSRYAYANRVHDMMYEVTAYDPPQRYAITATAGPFPFRGTLDLADVPQGTRVTRTTEAGSDGLFTSITFAVLGPLLRVLMRKQIGEDLARLEAALEAQRLPAG